MHSARLPSSDVKSCAVHEAVAWDVIMHRIAWICKLCEGKICGLLRPTVAQRCLHE